MRDDDGAQNWHYVDYVGQVGPLTLEQLRQAILKFPEPDGVLVWRYGLTNWVRAGDVAELARRPPPPPPDEMPTWRVKWWWYPIPFISIGIGSQVGRKVMIWNSVQRRKARQARRAASGRL